MRRAEKSNRARARGNSPLIRWWDTAPTAAPGGPPPARPGPANRHEYFVHTRVPGVEWHACSTRAFAGVDVSAIIALAVFGVPENALPCRSTSRVLDVDDLVVQMPAPAGAQHVFPPSSYRQLGTSGIVYVFQSSSGSRIERRHVTAERAAVVIAWSGFRLLERSTARRRVLRRALVSGNPASGAPVTLQSSPPVLAEGAYAVHGCRQRRSAVAILRLLSRR